EHVTFEWGDDGDANEVDTPAAPKAEGGYFTKGSVFNYGVYLGNEDPEIVSLRNSASTIVGGTFLRPDNTLDLFLGGETGRPWGANLSYSSNKAEAGGLERD